MNLKSGSSVKTTKIWKQKRKVLFILHIRSKTWSKNEISGSFLLAPLWPIIEIKELPPRFCVGEGVNFLVTADGGVVYRKDHNQLILLIPRINGGDVSPLLPKRHSGVDWVGTIRWSVSDWGFVIGGSSKSINVT